jgi:hypothetical protein
MIMIFLEEKNKIEETRMVRQMFNLAQVKDEYDALSLLPWTNSRVDDGPNQTPNKNARQD